MHRFVAALLLAVVSFASQSHAQRDNLAYLDELVQLSMQNWKVPGTALVLVHNDQVVWVKGYGQRSTDDKLPVTSATVFPLASCSKSFTSAAIAQLVHEGKLHWDDRVTKHLPNFRLHDPKATELVTIRDLLSHRTGVGGHDLLWYRAPWQPAESIRRLAHLPASGTFRGSFYYQSVMYMALGEIIAKHHDKHWAGYVREHILAPLGMEQTFLTYSEGQKQPDAAVAYRRSAKGTIEAIPWYTQEQPNAAGSVCISANDLGRWLRFQITGRSATKRILPMEIIAEMHRPHTVIPLEGFSRILNPDSVQLSYAQAWIVQDYRGIKLVQHGGLIDGFRVHLTMLPDLKIGLGILTNLHDTRMPLALSNLVIDYVLKFPPKDWNAYYGAVVREDEKAKEEAAMRLERERDPNSKPSVALNQFAGEYEHPAYGTCRIVASGSQLRCDWSSFKVTLEHISGDRFLARNLYLNDPLVEFSIGEKKVKGLRFLDMDFARK
jgi:CubicO group peptidase (beta-lactamase class C family)